MFQVTIIRSSHRRCSVRKGVPRNFAKFTGKHLCQSLLFNKVAGLMPVTYWKETLAQVFFCEFCEISKKIFFTEHLRWLLMYHINIAGSSCLEVFREKGSNGLQFYWKETPTQVFSCEFCKILKMALFRRTPVNDCFDSQ